MSGNQEQAKEERREAEAAAANLQRAMRALAANLLRVIAGAGKDYELTGQMAGVLNAQLALNKVANFYPHEIERPIRDALNNLDWRREHPAYRQSTAEDQARWEEDGTASLKRAEQMVRTASLRLVAAQLAQQPSQESAANHDLNMALFRHRQAMEKFGEGHRTKA